MKCQVCGNESGKYPLCKACNAKKDVGEIIKCTKCNKWHYINSECAVINLSSENFLYELKPSVLTKSEQSYFYAIKVALPDGYCIFPQQSLTAFIDKTDNSIFRNEMFRIVDFLITDDDFNPKIVIEIQDQSHLNRERKQRDEKIQNICEEAGIPIIKLWTSYGINNDYIKNKIEETLKTLPMNRIHHFSKPTETPVVENTTEIIQQNNNYKKSQPKRYKRKWLVLLIFIAAVFLIYIILNLFKSL